MSGYLLYIIVYIYKQHITQQLRWVATRSHWRRRCTSAEADPAAAGRHRRPPGNRPSLSPWGITSGRIHYMKNIYIYIYCILCVYIFIWMICTCIYIYNHIYMSGWWFQPKDMKVHWDDSSQYMEKQKMFQTTN